MKVAFDQMDFWKRVNKFSRTYSVDVGLVMRTQMALWAKDLMKNSYPKGDHPNKGKATVKSSINNCIWSIGNINSEDYDYKWEYNGRKLFRKGRTYWSIPGSMKVGGQRDLPRHHQSQRNKFTGRVPRGAIVMLTPENFKQAYIKEVQQHVGRLKSGWILAYEHFSAMADKRFFSANFLPWVWRHRNWAIGSGYSKWMDTIKTIFDIKSTTSGTLISGSNVPWAKDDGILEDTQRTRQRDLEKWLWVRMKDKIKQNSKAA